MKKTVRLASGTLLTLSAPTDDAVSGYGMMAQFYVGTGLRGFSVGPVGYLDRACVDMMPAELRSRAPYGAFELRIAVGVDNLVTLAALRGPYHDVMTVFGGPPVSQKQVELAFAGLDIVDSPEGMTLTPLRKYGLTPGPEDATVIVRQRGILHLLVGAQAASSVPPWAGSKTQHGEVWLAEADGSDSQARPSYILACDRAAAEIHPSADHPVDGDWSAWLNSLSLTVDGAPA